MTLPRYTTADDLPDPTPEFGWMADGARAGADLDEFFHGQPEQTIARFCDCCPVRVDCLKFARDRNITHGVYGGRTPGNW